MMSDAPVPRHRRPCGGFPVAWIAAALALWAVAAGGAEEAAPPPNLVLLTLDTTRADHLGAWGWPYARTPHLDALAARGTRFARCDTAAPITLPSHATLLTGLYPPRHGVRDNGAFTLPAEIPTLAEALAAAGYDTAAVVSAVVLERRHGLDRGFRLYDDAMGAAGDGERPAGATTAAALEALGRLRRPFFLWVHYFDPHEAYRPPAAFAEGAPVASSPHRLYDGEIAYMDSEIGKLLAALPPGVVIAAAGDHGEMLGEHGEAAHGLLLYHGARRVPLILAGPGVPAGRTQECLTRTADVAPTLLALAGLEAPAGLDGRPLLPLARSCEALSYSESFLPFFAYGWYPLRGLSSDRFFYLQAPEPSLYQLPSDPEEDDDLAPAQPETARFWRARLARLLAAMGEELEGEVETENVLSAEERRQLASLGYLGGGGGGEVKAALPDPRDMTDVDRRLHRAADEVAAGRCPEILRELQDIARRDPRNFPALTLTGLCLQEAGRHESALALFRRAAAENPLSAVPVANAAACLRALGRSAEAEAEYRRALTLDPALPEAAANLAQMLRESGRPAAALEILEGALAAGARDAGLHLERGLLRAQDGRLTPALEDFRLALTLDPGNLAAGENAARAAYHLGRLEEAAGLYEDLLARAPERGDLWKTLGALYLYELERPAQALPCLRRALALETEPAERAALEELLRSLGAGSG